MNKASLKKVVKEMVRDSITELFAEMHLESIVKKVVSEGSAATRRTPKHRRPTLREASQVPFDAPLPDAPPAPSAPAQASNGLNKEGLRERMNIDEDVWRDIYADTAESDNPVLTGEEGGGSVETAPEGELRKAGLMKDYSKFI